MLQTEPAVVHPANLPRGPSLEFDLPRQSIAPLPPLVHSPDHLVQHRVYEIVPAHASPSVDLRKMLTHLILPSCMVPMFMRWQRRFMAPAGVMFAIAPVVTCAILFVPARLGRQLAVLSFLLQTPLVTLGGMSLRTDMLKLLLGTFEFWFFTFANTATCVVMALCYDDLRALYLVPIWLGVEFNICIDAAVRGSRLLIMSLLIGVVYHSTVMVVVAFDAIPDVQTFQVMNYGPRALAASDFITNMVGTVIYMLVRALYRRSGVICGKSSQKKQATEDGKRRVRCVSYRCGVRLQPKTTAALDAPLDARASVNQSHVQFVQLDRVFDSCESMLCGRNVTCHRLALWQRLLIHAIGAVGLSLTGIMFLVLNYVFPYPPVAKAAAIAAPVFTIPYCVICVSIYHPGLLRHLCLSVDFLFMAVQFLFAHVCAAYVFTWDHRAFVLLASFCWVMTMLTIDAFTPAARHKIGFRLHFLLPLVCASITAHVMIANEVANRNSTWRLEDQIIFQAKAFGRRFDLHVMPAFFNRVWMLVVWELRVLWRILKSSRHSLIMIHGVVDLEVASRPRLNGVYPAAASERSVRDSTAHHRDLK